MKSWLEDDQVVVQIQYNPSLIDKLRRLDGKWDPDEKVWRLPKEEYNNWLLMVDEYSRHHKLPRDTRLKIIHNYLVRRGYSKKTIDSYVPHIKRFLEHMEDVVTVDSINDYILYLIEEREASFTYCNQAINAIKIYMREFGLASENQLIKLERPKKQKKLPKVMSKKDIKNLLEHVSNIKHKTALMLAYSCGLRVSETASIKINSIDPSRMVVNVSQGKGRKDRITTLSPKMLEQIKAYRAQYCPKEFLFENPTHDGPLSSRTLQRVFTKTIEELGLRKELTFHSLRHSYATHLLESGVDIRYIQELLGHQNAKTTEIYTHVSTQALQSIVNPLDQL